MVNGQNLITQIIPTHAHRLDRLPPYQFAVIGQRITEMTAAGQDVIRLDIGSPDLPPPDAAIEALKVSASNPAYQSYGNYRGEASFRKAIADYYARHFGVTLDPTKGVIPLIGSKDGLVNITLAYVDHGDAVIVPDIGYPVYSMSVFIAGGSIIYSKLDPARRYLIDFEALERDLAQAEGTPKLLWVSYPNNPTGAVATLDFYQEAVEFCRRHHLLLCSDNPYCEVVYDGYVAPSVLQVPGAMDCSIEFMSLSKTYNMAGFRLGACVGNHQALEALITIKSNIDTGHYKPIYDAGTAAMNTTSDSWIAERNLRYEKRRDMILDVLPEIGLEAHKTLGSLYIWAKVLDGDENRYAEEALNEAQIAVAPGTIYGPGGRGYVRLSITVNEVRLEEAVARLRRWYRGKH